MASSSRTALGLSMATLLALASTPVGAASGPCSEPGGMPLADGTGIQCTVSTSLAEVGGTPLSSKTFGLVSEVEVKSVLRLPLGADTLTGILGEHKIQIPPQDIQVDVKFTDGKVLPALITVSPSISVEGSDACSLTVTDAGINMVRFESGLPDWIDNTVVHFVNGSPKVKATLVEGATASVARLKQQFCF